MALPNFLCVGAQKAGTTTLHNILNQHPQIFLPRFLKEPHFFDSERQFSQGSHYYELSYFAEAKNEKCIGEITPSYLAVPEAPERILETLGADVKLLVCLRHPVARAYSHYLMNYNWLWENESFQDAIGLEAERTTNAPHQHLRYNYLERGMYHKLISRYLQYFPLEQMHFILFEDELVTENSDWVQNVFEFLGADRHVVRTDIHANKNRSTEVLQVGQNSVLKIQEKGKTRTQSLAQGSVVVNPDQAGRLRIVRNPSPGFIRYVGKHITNRPPEKLDGDTRQALYDMYFRKDVSQLQTLIGRDLSAWE